MTTRIAGSDDLDTIVALHGDPPEPEDGTGRRARVAPFVESGRCLVAIDGERVVGYCLLDYSFFDCGWVPLLWIEAGHRRRGHGTRLLEHVVRICRTPKLFTSTNESNTAMQALLARLDWVPSGVVHNLDPGDPEAFYFRSVH